MQNYAEIHPIFLLRLLSISQCESLQLDVNEVIRAVERSPGLRTLLVSCITAVEFSSPTFKTDSIYIAEGINKSVDALTHSDMVSLLGKVREDYDDDPPLGDGHSINMLQNGDLTEDRTSFCVLVIKMSLLDILELRPWKPLEYDWLPGRPVGAPPPLVVIGRPGF